MSRICHEIVIDHTTGQVTLDGLTLGLYIEPDPEVEVLDDGTLGVVRLGIFADNIKVITRKGSERVQQASIESELAWARRMARETVITEMEPVLRWLRDSAIPHGFRQRYLTGIGTAGCG